VRVEFEALAGTPHVALQHGLPGSIEVTVEQTTPALLVLRAAGGWTSRPMQQANTAADASAR
jgi:hypothetical protein